jgi:hypothetical protein
MALNIIFSALLSVSGKGIIILSKNCIITLLLSLISCTVTQRPTQALNFTFRATSMLTGNDFLNIWLSRCLKARPQSHSTRKDISHQLLLGERQASKSTLTLKNKSIGNGQWVFTLYTDFMYAEHTTLALKTLKAALWENPFTVTVGVALKHGTELWWSLQSSTHLTNIPDLSIKSSKCTSYLGKWSQVSPPIRR